VKSSLLMEPKVEGITVRKRTSIKRKFRRRYFNRFGR
jgi:hypothetical protein